MSLAIVGSRNFNNYDILVKGINDALNSWNLDLLYFTEIVSGGASGADTLAERFANEHQIPTKIFRPEWNIYGKAAGILRNTDIINNATHVIAFPAKDSKGTFDSIRKAQNRKTPLYIINV